MTGVPVRLAARDEDGDPCYSGLQFSWDDTSSQGTQSYKQYFNLTREGDLLQVPVCNVNIETIKRCPARERPCQRGLSGAVLGGVPAAEPLHRRQAGGGHLQQGEQDQEERHRHCTGQKTNMDYFNLFQHISLS